MSVVLSEHLPLLATAPDGIQKLRGLILELAVRGKLVPQDPNDEPASELLKRIAKERARLEADGTRKKSRPMPLVGNGESSFEVPAKWEWTSLDVIALKITDGEHISPKKTQSGMMLLTAKHVIESGVSLDDPQYVALEDGLRFRERCDPTIGDVLICSRGTIGRCCVVTHDAVFCLMGSVILVRPSSQLVPAYLNNFLKSEIGQHFIRGATKGMAVNALYLKDIRQCMVPLPPFAEQHRIVAKIDELMALCDRLEAEQTDAAAAHERLVATLLDTLTQSTDAADLATNWQRLAEHFDTLFTTESSLDALKQTILQLAVMGKLVPQDPNDEPASELLKRIAKERARLEADGKIKKSKPLPLVAEDERPFTIPKTWNWIRLGALTEVITKGSSPKWQGIEYVTLDEGVLFITSENVGNYLLRKLDALKYVDPRFNDIEPRSILRYGDILINLVGASIGRTARFDLRVVANINQAVALVRLINAENIDPTYLLHFLNSDFAINHMLASQVVNAQPNISLTDVRDFPVPFPPLAEQHRIVAKVDELMALVDRLKAGLAESRTRQVQLADTLIETALKAA